MRKFKVLLLVDLSNKVYQAAAAHPNLSSRRVFTGGLYGFFTTVSKIIRETRASHVVFCQDRKPYVRSLDYPEYKLLRKKSADEDLKERFSTSMEQVLGVLHKTGIEPWGIDGYEVDDLIGYASQRYQTRFDMIYAASNDSDLFQLLDIPNFAIYSKGIEEVMTIDKLFEAQKLTPAEFMLMTALTGTHNDIAGIDRVGPVTAKKALGDPALMAKLQAEHGALIKRNLALIKLPHPSFPRNVSMPMQGPLDLRAFYRMLDSYDIDVTNAMSKAFEQIDHR